MRLLKLIVNNPLGIPKNRFDPERDGISPTLLSVWSQCREKARLRLLGWKKRKGQPGMIFGTIVHDVLDRCYSAIQSGKISGIPSSKFVRQVCADVEKRWRRHNTRADSETVELMESMMLLAEAIMPIYFTFWNVDMTRMDWWHLEEKIGDTMPLREFGKYRSRLYGKLDGAFLYRKDKSKRKWLFETKTKSNIGEQGESNIVDIMPMERQTTLYLGALQDANKGELPGGVLKNIIRRPGLRQKKGESLKAFAVRVAEDIKRRPEFYFLRFRMELDPKEFRRQRVLADAMFADFLAWYHGDAPHYHNSDACEHKHGTCEFLKICSAKDYTGMYQSKPRRGEQE